jgi:hypothetical protein
VHKGKSGARSGRTGADTGKGATSDTTRPLNRQSSSKGAKAHHYAGRTTHHKKSSTKSGTGSDSTKARMRTHRTATDTTKSSSSH